MKPTDKQVVSLARKLWRIGITERDRVEKRDSKMTWASASPAQQAAMVKIARFVLDGKVKL